MSEWKRTLNLSDIWNDARCEKITVQELSLIISKRLNKLKIFKEENIEDEKQDLIDEFFCLSDDKSSTQEEFNWSMEALYNWADYKKTCWIKTIFK